MSNIEAIKHIIESSENCGTVEYVQETEFGQKCVTYRTKDNKEINLLESDVLRISPQVDCEGDSIIVVIIGNERAIMMPFQDIKDNIKLEEVVNDER